MKSIDLKAVETLRGFPHCSMSAKRFYYAHIRRGEAIPATCEKCSLWADMYSKPKWWE